MSLNNLLKRGSVPQPTSSEPSVIATPRANAVPSSFPPPINTQNKPIIAHNVPSPTHSMAQNNNALNSPLNQSSINVPVQIQRPMNNNPSSPVVEEYMMAINIKRYPDGRTFCDCSMWQKGIKNIVPKRKPKGKGAKVEVQKAKKKSLFDVVEKKK